MLAAVLWTPLCPLRCLCGKAGPRWRGEDKARKRNKSQKTGVGTSGSNLPPKLLIPSMLEHCLCITCRAIFVHETERERERENIFPLRSFLLTFSSKKINVLSSPFHSLALHPADSQPCPPKQWCAGFLWLMVVGTFGPLNLTPPWNFFWLFPWKASSPPPLFQISLFQISLLLLPSLPFRPE